jgi:hypothetical protein
MMSAGILMPRELDFPPPGYTGVSTSNVPSREPVDAAKGVNRPA